MSLARRIVEHFVIPGGDLRAGGGEGIPMCEEASSVASACLASPTVAESRAVAASPTVAVLAAPPDAPALGAAVGLALARRRRAPVVAVCLWSPGQSALRAWRAPALPAARRLAAGLAARGYDARAAGRLAVVRLAGCDEEAAVAARRVLAAASAAPAVLALGGPRVAAFDALLAEQDLVVVGTRGRSDPVLTRLAVAGLAGAARVCACEVPAAHPARSLATAGVALLPSAWRAMAGPVGELS